MDPNTEGGPPKADVAEVDVTVESAPVEPPSGPSRTAAHPLPVFEPMTSGDIFRNAFRTPQSPQKETRSAPLAPSAATTPADPTAMNEEEFQRRIRGGYEKAQDRLSDVVNSNMSRSLRLSAIRLAPPPPTSRAQFLSSLISPFLSPPPPLPSWLSWLHPAPPPARNLHEVLLSTRALMAHLDRFGVFDVDHSAVRLQPVRGGDPDEVELVLALRERGRLFLKAGTEVGGGEGGGNITARIRNALGGAETVEVNASIGTKTKSAYQVSLSTPVLDSPLLAFALQGFSFDRDNTAFASHREYAQGGRARLSAIALWGTHDLTYEYIKRDITHLSPNASVSIRELAHPTTKSSISHTWTSDSRNDPWTGTSGRLYKLTNEYAGLPGSSTHAHFFKTIFQSQLSRSLYPGSNIRYSLSSMTTAITPLFPATATPLGHPPATPLPDRAFLGGPNSMRGWKVGGIGLRDGPDSLGGDLAWAMGLSLLSPVPGKPHWPMFLHGFLNVGKVMGYDRSRTFVENMVKSYDKPNVSVGIGLMYRLEPIRIELNFGMPLIARKGERLSRGFGLGVGIEFL